MLLNETFKFASLITEVLIWIEVNIQIKYRGMDAR